MFRFASPADTRPCVLAKNLTNYGMFWQEWEHGIAGNKAAKLWEPEDCNGSSTYSRRKPIYLLLDRTIHVKGKLPAEAFRLMEIHFGARRFGAAAELIRQHERNGTMPQELACRSHPLNLQPPRRKRSRQ